MPITHTLTEIKPFIKPSVYSALTKKTIETDSTTNFTNISAEAEKIIYNNSSFTTTDDVSAWSLLPFAYIVQKLTIPLLDNVEKELNDRIEMYYNFALTLIEQAGVSSTPSDHSGNYNANFNEVIEW